MIPEVEKNRASWLEPNRNWRGRHALVPFDTCHRILDTFLWFMAAIGVYAVVMVYVRGTGLMRANPLFWLVSAFQGPMVLAAIFRGWSFPLRYGILSVNLLVFTVCASAVLGITPNWAFEIIILTATTSLFFGVRAGLAMVLLVSAAHIVVAWGWITGRLPAFMPGAGAAATFMDFTAAPVWARVLIVAAASQAALVLLMRYVLRDMNDALQQANATLQKLAVEQEYRARAEEARLKAELAGREAQKFDALGRLASGVAHDFNNALCVIKCWSSFLSEEKRDPQVTEAMADIRRATENAEQLTHHLLAFSRSDPGRKEVVDLAEVARLEGKTLSRLLPKNVAVTVDAPNAHYVRLGRGPLQEVLLNLAINARDAMPQGGRLGLKVNAEALVAPTNGLAPGNYVCLEVSDSGQGMDAATQARIFEPFFTTKQAGRGTGLGLAMVYGLVNGAGGGVQVSSQVGHGTRFTIHLPAATAGEAAVMPKPASITAPVRCRVLIAEYQPEIRLLIERILAKEGFPVIAVANGDEALAALAVDGSRFGLLVTGGVMPGRPTDEIVRRALEVEPECRVVIVSDQRQDELMLRGIEAGRSCRLPKPFDAGQLREAVNDVLRRTAA
jgi:signal transduction histidine kinase